MKVVRTDDYIIKECLPDNLSCVLGIRDPDVCCGFNFIFDMKSQFTSYLCFYVHVRRNDLIPWNTEKGLLWLLVWKSPHSGCFSMYLEIHLKANSENQS